MAALVAFGIVLLLLLLPLGFHWFAQRRWRAVKARFGPPRWPADAGGVLERSGWGTAALGDVGPLRVRLSRCAGGLVAELAVDWQDPEGPRYLLMRWHELHVARYPRQGWCGRSECCGLFTPRAQLFVFGRLARFAATEPAAEGRGN